MLLVVIGITYGTLLGTVSHLLLFRFIDHNKRQGNEPLKGVGGVFLIRYVLDAIALLLFALITRDGPGITAAAVSITVAVKISLFVVYTRKGGKIG